MADRKILGVFYARLLTLQLAILRQLDYPLKSTWPMLIEILSSILPSVTPLGLPFLHQRFMLTGLFALATDIPCYVEFPIFSCCMFD